MSPTAFPRKLRGTLAAHRPFGHLSPRIEL